MVSKDSSLSVRRQCELLGVTRSQVYYEAKEANQAAVERKEAIMSRIDYWHTMLPCCGSRKLVQKVREDGYQVNRKTVRRYMDEMGICAVYPKPNLSKRDFKAGIVPYLLKNKEIIFPNQAWSIDITYIRMNHGHMYLTAIIDWFSRKIVGWNLSDTLSTGPVLDAVKDATEKHGIPAILNSDQGSQFTSDEYKRLLTGLHIRQSMDGKSRWADNIMIERWFRSLKTELININEYHSPKELRKAIREYIELYNTQRPHQALEYRTPEKEYHAAFAA